MITTISLVACCLFFVCISTCSAHLCLLSPLQRQGVTSNDINVPASKACFTVKGPCGDKPEETPSTGLMVGKNATVVFQKNLDHYNAANRGYFSVSIMTKENGWQKMVATNKNGLQKPVVTVADSNTPSLHLYAVNFQVPADLNSDEPAILQVQYVTNNPKAPAVFYQCADIILI